MGYYTGLKIKGGTLNFDVDATVTDGGLFSAPATKIALHLDLDQNVIGSASTEAGLDAANADVQLPQTVDFEFTLASSNGKQAMPAVLRSVAKRLFFFKMRPRNGNRCCNRFLFHTTCNRWSRRRINF